MYYTWPTSPYTYLGGQDYEVPELRVRELGVGELDVRELGMCELGVGELGVCSLSAQRSRKSPVRDPVPTRCGL